MIFAVLSTYPVIQLLRGVLVFERGVLAFAAVEDFNLLEASLCLDFPMTCEACAVNTFVLEAVEPALDQNIVPAVTFATHRAGHASGF